MPLTKQYLRYSPSGCFNCICSPNSNNAWITLKGQDGRFVATGSCEDIVVWDLQLNERSMLFPGEKSVVTRICASPTKRHLAAGYRDGVVKIFELASGDVLAVFSGHKSAITTLGFDTGGHKLASGSKDTHVVVWDTIAEAGISRLSAHTGPVTQVSFLHKANVLISSSEDTTVKFWDLDTNHCFKTLLGHRTEVWGFALVRDGEYLVTGCGDSELRVWNIVNSDDSPTGASSTVKNEDNDIEEDEISAVKVVKMGSVLRSSTKKVVGMSVERGGRVVAVHGAQDSLELFRFLSQEEAAHRLRKRKRKERKKQAKGSEVEATTEVGDPSLQDVVKRLPVVKATAKIKSADVIMGLNEELRVAVNLANNSLELHSVKNGAEAECARRVAQQGHRGDVRAVAWSGDGLAVASGGADAVRLWNRASLACLRAVPVAQVVSLAFVPGDRHLLAGTKDGRLMVVDVSVGEVLEDIAAHETELWSIVISPNQRGCVTGAGDKAVKFWDFELVADERQSKVLSLLHRRTLTLEEPVLCVRVAPDSKLIAVALLDMTIKLFFMDTLKFFLSLYGHKLPVTSMDISHDSSLLVSGSADRNVKVWGMDFGDCHKSIFAHDSSVTCVQFVPDTHYFFTAGKDGRVKQWDADSFQNVLTLQGHFGEAWALAISPNGAHVVSAGSDRVLRLVERTDEPLVLEDDDDRDELVTGHDSAVRGQGALTLPTRKTVNSEIGAEQLLECLESSRLYAAELEDFSRGGERGQAPLRPPLMIAFGAKTVDDFIVKTISRIRSSELEEALLLLPFSAACELLRQLPSVLVKSAEVELVSRTLVFLLKVHHGPIVGSRELLSVLARLQQLAVAKVSSLRDLVGENLYGLHYIQRSVEEREGIQLFREATIERKAKAKKKKRKQAAFQRAVLTI